MKVYSEKISSVRTYNIVKHRIVENWKEILFLSYVSHFC